MTLEADHTENTPKAEDLLGSSCWLGDREFIVTGLTAVEDFYEAPKFSVVVGGREVSAVHDAE